GLAFPLTGSAERAMTVTVNGQPWELPDGATLADVLDRFGAPSCGVAVALDGAVVSRRSWPATSLRAGACIEVLTAVQGG
ncbi:MAG: sulfur carrier protein ThiS, partial [Pseudonocardiaceae bacterium]